MPELHWPTAVAEPVAGQVCRIAREVSALGGAVGWLAPISASEAADWYATRMAAAAAGTERFCAVADGGEVLAVGRLTFNPHPVRRWSCQVNQVMTAPAARGRGLGRVLVSALVDRARADGMESVDLDVRGNNHAAIRLYASLGFTEAGVLRDLVAVGDDRFDMVLMQLRLGLRPGATSHGRAPEGPGASA